MGLSLLLHSTEAASGWGLGRLSMHLEIQCGSLSVTVYKTRPLQRLFGTRKCLTVKMSNWLSLHQAQTQTETYRLLFSMCPGLVLTPAASQVSWG